MKLITEENSQYKQLEKNLNRILNKGKAQMEAERLKKEEENMKNEFNKDEFIYQLQGEINILDARERKIEQMNSSSDEPTEPLYPKELDNLTLEIIYIALLYGNPNAISKYYFEKNLCYFSSEIILNLYKSVIFKEGEKQAPPQLKEGFNFPKAIAEHINITKEIDFSTSFLYSIILFSEIKTDEALRKELGRLAAERGAE